MSRYYGAIPLDPEISLSGDSGVPILVSHPESAAAKAFLSAAEKLAAQISINVLSAGQEQAGAMAHSWV